MKPRRPKKLKGPISYKPSSCLFIYYLFIHILKGRIWKLKKNVGIENFEIFGWKFWNYLLIIFEIIHFLYLKIGTHLWVLWIN